MSSAAEWLLFQALGQNWMEFLPVFPFAFVCATNTAAFALGVGALTSPACFKQADLCMWSGLYGALTMSIAMSLLTAGSGSGTFCHPQPGYIE